MIEIFKKTFLAGAGLVNKTWEEVEALSKEIAKRPRCLKKRGQNF
jgi:hypothetical protein